jgi:hypothetical protein
MAPNVILRPSYAAILERCLQKRGGLAPPGKLTRDLEVNARSLTPTFLR